MATAIAKQAFAGEGIKRTTAFSIEPERIKVIDDPAHPLYDERVKMPIDEALVKNIMVYGVREPVLVRKEGDQIVCVAGRRRIKNAVEANKRLKAEGKETISVPAMKEDGEDVDLFGVMVLENELRTDDSVLAKARKAAKLLAMCKDKQKVAVTFGVSQATVDNWNKLLSATAKVRNAVESEKITPTAAYRLATLDPEKQDAALDELLEEAASGKGKATAKKAASKTAAKKKGKGKDEEAHRPSIKKVTKLHEVLTTAMQGMAKKDSSYEVFDTATEILNWVITGDEGEFVALAFAGLAEQAAPAKEEKAPKA